MSAQRKRGRDDALDQTVVALLSRLPHYAQYSQARQVALPTDDPVYAYLERHFVEHVTAHRGPKQGDPHREPPKFEVARIEQLFSRRLQDKYIAAVQDEMGLCNQQVSPLDVAAVKVQTFQGTEMNEFLLYHGSPSGLVPRLVLQGLDPRNAGSNAGKLFGAGTYLASHSSKSDIYTKPNERGERCVLLVRACLGEAHRTKQPMREELRPPERADKRGPLSSVAALTATSGGCVEHPEYIVYKDSQALPQFAIYYKHQEDCKCTHCWREAEDITLHVQGVDGNDVAYSLAYKISPSTPLKALMDKHREQLRARGVPLPQGLSFFHDGVQIEGQQTAAQLEMEDNDIIDAMGGAQPSTMSLKVVTWSGQEIFYKVKPTTKMERLFNAFCERLGLNLSDVRFKFNGRRVRASQDCAHYEMQDGDVIEVELL